jgi:hypothetical protein
MEVFIDGNVTNITNSLIVYHDKNYKEKTDNAVPYYDLNGNSHHVFLESFQYIDIIGYSFHSTLSTGRKSLHAIFTDKGVFSCDFRHYLNSPAEPKPKPILIQAIGSISDNEYIRAFSGNFLDISVNPSSSNRYIQFCITNYNNIYWMRSEFEEVPTSVYDKNDAEGARPEKLKLTIAKKKEDSFIMKIPDHCQWYNKIPADHAYIVLHGIQDDTLTIYIIFSLDGTKLSSDDDDEDVKEYIKNNCKYEHTINGVSAYNIESTSTDLKIKCSKGTEKYVVTYPITNGNPDIDKKTEESYEEESQTERQITTDDRKIYELHGTSTIRVDQNKIMSAYYNETETAKLTYENTENELVHNLIPMDDIAAKVFPVESDGTPLAIDNTFQIYSIQNEQGYKIAQITDATGNTSVYNLNLFGWTWTEYSAFYMHTNKGIFYVCTPPGYFIDFGNYKNVVRPKYSLINTTPDKKSKKALVFTLLKAEDVPIDYTTCDILKYAISSKSNVHLAMLDAYNADSFNDITHVMRFTGTTDITGSADDYSKYTSDNPFPIKINTNSKTGIIGDNYIKINVSLECTTNTNVVGSIRLTMGGYRYSAFGIYLTDAPIVEDEGLVYAAGNIIAPNIHKLTNKVQTLYNTINTLAKTVDTLNDRLEVLEYNCSRIKRIQ